MAKQWTEAERKAFADKMAQARKQKSQNKQTSKKDKTVEIPESKLQELLKRLDNLEHSQAPTQTFNQPQFNNQNRVVGIVQEFSTKPFDYENPIPKLLSEPEFEQFGLKHNYDLIWSVKPVNYQTKDGLNHVEPRFEMELNLLARDDNNELIKNENGTYKALAFRKAYFFEDKESAEYAAHDMGLDLAGEDIFNRLRYQKIKQWLKGVFTPPKPVNAGQGNRTEIWNNQEFRVIDSVREEIL